MRYLDKKFENREIDYDKLLGYGFSKKGNCYSYEKNIFNNRFKVLVELSEEKKISKVIDLSMDDEYILVDVRDSFGSFIGKIKEEYENILDDIIKTCCVSNVFQGNQVKEVIKYIKEKYGDDLEYLWEKFPDNAIWRNKQSKKWYGVLLKISKSKLGLNSGEVVDIINLRYPKTKIKEIIDGEKVFGGYHMNKNNWITIKLDGSIDISEIFNLIDNSFKISLEK